MKNVLIFGASGHSKMIVDIIEKNKVYTLKGFIDSHKPVGEKIYNYSVLGNDDQLTELIEQHNIFGIIIGIGDNYIREIIYNKVLKRAPQLQFVSIIHPSAILANGVKIPQGTVVMADVVINSDARIGEFCILNTKSSVGHDSTLENFSSLASGVILGGNVHIGYATAISIRATIIQGITIGKHSVIGAASLVVKSIGDYKKAFGSPIDTIENREPGTKYLG